MDFARPVGLGSLVRGTSLLLRHPGSAGGAPLRHRDFLSWKPCGAAVRARSLARRSAGDPAASTAERLAVDLRLLHDLRSAHHARRAAWPFAFRGHRSDSRPLPRILHADAAGTLYRADRARAPHFPDRPSHSCRTVRLAPSGHAGSTTMKLNLERGLRASVAIAAVVAQLAAISGPAAAFCGFYVAKADAKLFNKSSKVVL